MIANIRFFCCAESKSNSFVGLSKGGFVKTDDKMQTSLDGVFACGDLREGSLKQIATAVGDGAIAGTQANKYVLLYDYKYKSGK